jgi:hypothetical protein
MNKKYILSICLIVALPLQSAQMSKIKVACSAGLIMTAHALQVLAVSDQPLHQTAAQTPFLDFVKSVVPEITPAVIVQATIWSFGVSLYCSLVPPEYFFMYAPL